jgi:hypothetical protein
MDCKAALIGSTAQCPTEKRESPNKFCKYKSTWMSDVDVKTTLIF